MQLIVSNLKTRSEKDTIIVNMGLKYSYVDGRLVGDEEFQNVISAINNGTFVSIDLTYPITGITHNGKLGQKTITQTIIQGDMMYIDNQIGSSIVPCSYILDNKGNPIIKLDNETDLDDKNICLFKTTDDFLDLHNKFLYISSYNYFGAVHSTYVTCGIEENNQNDVMASGTGGRAKTKEL